jgi:hypothetical protein
MVLKSIALPKNQRFAARRSVVKSAFRGVEPLSIWLGALGRRFEFDSRAFKRPKLKGEIVASVSVNREGSAIFQLFPVERAAYPSAAASEFEESVLPAMKRWLAQQLAKPATAILGSEQLIIEFAGGEHHSHELRYL